MEVPPRTTLDILPYSRKSFVDIKVENTTVVSSLVMKKGYGLELASEVVPPEARVTQPVPTMPKKTFPRIKMPVVSSWKWPQIKMTVVPSILGLTPAPAGMCALSRASILDTE